MNHGRRTHARITDVGSSPKQIKHSAHAAGSKLRAQTSKTRAGDQIWHLGAASTWEGWPKSKIVKTDSEWKNLIVKTGINRCCMRSYHTRKLELQKEPRIREKSWKQLGLTSRQSSKQNRTLVQGPKWAGEEIALHKSLSNTGMTTLQRERSKDREPGMCE
jgi:hypothetical protein